MTESIFFHLLSNLAGLLFLLPFLSPFIIIAIWMKLDRKHEKSISRYESAVMMINVPTNLHIDKKIFILLDEGTVSPRQVELGIVKAQFNAQVRVALLGQFRRVDENTISEVINVRNPGREYRIGEVIAVTQSRTQRPIYAKVVHFTVAESLN